jgi:hypothetical protein
LRGGEYNSIPRVDFEGGLKYGEYKSLEEEKGGLTIQAFSVQAFQRFSVSVVNLKHAFHSYILITN